MAESKISDKIHGHLRKLEELNAVQRHYEETSSGLKGAQKELNAMDKNIKKELKDIEKLEGLSVKGLFYKVLGSKEEQMEKERQEYLQLNLKRKELVSRVELLEYELDVLSKKVQKIDGLEAEVEHLKKLREKEIMVHPGPMRKRLLSLHGEIDEAHRYHAELQEAYKAGMDTMQSTQIIIDHLRNAKKWGNWDQMGRSRRYDHMKHTAIDRAVRQAYHTQNMLKIFARELRDVGINMGQIDIHIESIGGFLDMLFDNLITDWLVQNKIKNALRNIETNYDRIVRLVKTLEAEANNTKNLIQELSDNKHKLLVE